LWPLGSVVACNHSYTD